MAVCYSVVFSPEEATAWVSFEDREDLGLQAQKAYRLQAEGEGELQRFAIFNDRQEKVYSIWEQARGDFIA